MWYYCVKWRIALNKAVLYFLRYITLYYIYVLKYIIYYYNKILHRITGYYNTLRYTFVDLLHSRYLRRMTPLDAIS